MLTRHGESAIEISGLAQVSNAFRNVTFLERPFHPNTFTSVVETAYKARLKQYDVRASIEELKENQIRLHSALAAGQLGTWELNVDTSAFEASPQCKQVFGRKAQDAFTLKDLLSQAHRDDVAALGSVFRGSDDETEDHVLRFRNIWRDGTLHWTELRARTTRHVTGATVVTGIVSDITERKTFVESLQALNETLEQRVTERTAALEGAHQVVLKEIDQRQRTEALLRQAQKMEMIGQLTGGVAHDFNNLLMVVLGNLELLRKRNANDQKAERLIDAAAEGATRGAALTQRLLAFARKQDLNIELKSLSDLIGGMRDLLQSSIPSNIELTVTASEDLPTARVDGIQVELAALNLVVNARDAMPKGGQLQIATDSFEVGRFDGLNPGRYVRLIVTDTGAGMDSETLSRCAEPFFSTKEVGKGTGLGLSMVHGLAQQLHGALRLYSQVGQGTRAELWLPASDRPPEIAGRPLGVPSEQPNSLSAKILLVDDDALVASSTSALLEDSGYEVLTMDNAAEALDMLEHDSSIDLVITDFLMPKMNGVQLAEKAKKVRPKLPILLITGYAEIAGGLPADLPRIKKPFNQQALNSEVSRLLKRFH